MIIKAVNTLEKDYTQFIVFVSKDQTVSIPDTDLNQLVQEVIEAKKFSGKLDEITPLFKGAKVCALVGLGNAEDRPNMRKIGQLTSMVLQSGYFDLEKPVGVIIENDEEENIRGIVDGSKLGTYVWDKYKSKNSDSKDYHKLILQIQTRHQELVDRLSICCDGVNLARDLGNENADEADSNHIEQTIRTIIKDDKRCKIEVLNEIELQEKGFGLHLAVNQGSKKDPKLIIVTYQGGKEDDPYYALVGKGITFDTGGLNLKNTSGMVDMRLDMCGAATVVGTLQNTLKLNLKCNAYFVCGLAENAIGPRAYKPGDVLTSYCGKTVEILNTDAEGRLVMADANSYMAKNYKPEAIINIATLTGAVVIALGFEHTGLMSSDKTLEQRLLDAATKTDDRAWPLPIYSELEEHVKSQVADIKNTGQPKCAGTISAGEFLRQFAQFESKDQKWAHLDIAGTGTIEKELAYFKAGASGAGVRLLTEFLAQGEQ